MPIPEIDKLERGSNDAQKKAALSACIAEQVRQGKTQEQAVAICQDMVNSKSKEEE